MESLAAERPKYVRALWIMPMATGRCSSGLAKVFPIVLEEMPFNCSCICDMFPE
jgi:hypothetical protein